jgi:hypothetical protein
MSSSDSSSSESDISEEEYRDEDSSSSSSDDSSSDDSDDEGRKKSSRWRRRHRQLQRRAQETQEEAKETYNQEQQMLELEDDLEQNPETFYDEGVDPRSEAQAAADALAMEEAGAEAQAAAEALAREEAEAEAKAEEMRRQQALLAAMMSALAMIKMMQKKTQGNITKLKKNKPETENLIMAPALLWHGEVNGLALRPVLDITTSVAIKLATKCIKFEDIEELREKIIQIKAVAGHATRSGKVFNNIGTALKQQKKITEKIMRHMTKYEKAMRVKNVAGKEAAKVYGGTTGRVAEVGLNVASKGLRKGILDPCDIPIMAVRALFGKYPAECQPEEDIGHFFKYPDQPTFKSVAAADKFYGKILKDQPAKQTPLIDGGKYVPPTKEMESTLQRRRVKRRYDNDKLKKLKESNWPVFSDHGLNTAKGIEETFQEQKTFAPEIKFDVTNFRKRKINMQKIKEKKHEKEAAMSLKKLKNIMTDPTNVRNLGYWAKGRLQGMTQSIANSGKIPRWLRFTINAGNGESIPYFQTGGLTDTLGLWIRKLNINVNYGPNYTYDHYGCIFEIDLEGERELEPYYKGSGTKKYIKDHLDSRYDRSSNTLKEHDPHSPGHVKFQLRRMYQKAIDEGFRPSLKYKSKRIQEDALLKSYCDCFENWKEDMETQNQELEELQQMNDLQELNIMNQHVKIQQLPKKT